jgi:hypothetical protein
VSNSKVSGPGVLGNVSREGREEHCWTPQVEHFSLNSGVTLLACKEGIDDDLHEASEPTQESRHTVESPEQILTSLLGEPMPSSITM